MSFLSTNDLKKLLPTCIEPYDATKIKNVSYELSLGSEVFVTDSKNDKKEFLNDKNPQIKINAGQFALLLTKEKVSVPKDKLAFISIKAGEKLKGLVNVSGFHVDPGFTGNLLFSVYNAGPSPILLDFGQPCFLIWFSNLTEQLSDIDSYNAQTNTHQNQNKIDKKYIEHLISGELASPNAILKRLEKIKNDWVWFRNIFFVIVIPVLIAASIPAAKFYINILKANNNNDQIKQKEKKEAIQALKQPLDSIINHDADSVLSLKLKNAKTKP